MKNKTIFSAMLLMPFFASAYSLSPGVYSSQDCEVAVRQGANGVAYILEVTSSSDSNSLQYERIAIGADGVPVDGPGLCADEATMGANAHANVSAQAVAGKTRVQFSCGGTFKPIEVRAVVTINAAGAVEAFQETDKVTVAGYPPFFLPFKRSESLNCTGLVRQ